jgi:transcription initiation factor IIE alpha subunit
MDRDLQDLKKKVELKSEEERAYQVLVRNTRKDVEKIQDKMDSDVQEIRNKLNKVPTKEEVPTKESVEDLKKWVRYAWLATIFAVLALLANLALVIIPMVWKKGP